jgi:hypothetical protein
VDEKVRDLCANVTALLLSHFFDLRNSRDPTTATAASPLLLLQHAFLLIPGETPGGTKEKGVQKREGEAFPLARRRNYSKCLLLRQIFFSGGSFCFVCFGDVVSIYIFVQGHCFF